MTKKHPYSLLYKDVSNIFLRKRKRKAGYKTE